MLYPSPQEDLLCYIRQTDLFGGFLGGEGWRIAGDSFTDAGSTVIEAGSSIIINHRGSGLPWTMLCHTLFNFTLT